MGSGKSKLSTVLEHYLNGSPHKDEVDFIEQAITEANLTVLDLFVRALEDAARRLKMVDDRSHGQHQTMGHLQQSIGSVDYK